MSKKNFIKLILGLLLCSSFTVAQRRSNPSDYTPWTGIHDGNRIRISFHDDGQISGFLSGVDVRGEWPNGSGENYIGDLIPLIGVEFINKLGDTLHSVSISRGPRSHESEERHPRDNHFWGFNPRPGFRNNALDIGKQSPAMSHLDYTWPTEGWNDPVAANWKDDKGATQWFGYFGRGIRIRDGEESVYEADDQWDDEFNFKNFDEAQGALFLPDSLDATRHGMGLTMRVRGFQWSNFLAEDVLFWLFAITNEGTTIYRKAAFGNVVGTLAGGDGDSGDDLGDFYPEESITYSYDAPPGIGNHGQKVGYVGYAYLESPSNSLDGIDNDNDSKDGSSPRFVQADFDSVTYRAGDQVVLINPKTYERTLHQIKIGGIDTVFSMGVMFTIKPGKYFREGNIARYQPTPNGQIAIPDTSAYDGIDNDLDGLIDENESINYKTRILKGNDPVKYRNYITGAGMSDLLIDEKRDNDIDEDGDWDPKFDDVGIDGLGPYDNDYPGADFGEGNGRPDQGEPNFGRVDPHESDQIGLTSFNFFNLTVAPDMRDDEGLWNRMSPGRFDVIPPIPQDGDFIYASGYFPLLPSNGDPNVKQIFSTALLFGEDYNDIVANKKIVQQIYDQGYKFPEAPVAPRITIADDDGKVVLYWDGAPTETSRDFITKKQDFQGYKIYRATDITFQDAREITNAQGNLSFDKPLAQYDLIDSVKGYFYPSQRLLEQAGGTTFWLGSNTGIVNRFVDSNVVKGQTYYYAVCAYDQGEAALDIFPSENSKQIRRANTGEIITAVNTAYITPGARPVGYSKAKYSDLQKSPNFIGTGDVEVEIIDDKAIRNGFSYEIAFQDTGVQSYTTNWSLIDLQTPDTVYIPLTKETKIVNPTETLQLPVGTDTIFVNKLAHKVTGDTYTAPYDSLVARSQVFLGNTPIQHGYRVLLYNDAVIKQDTGNSKFEGIGGDPAPKYNFTVLKDVTNPQNNGTIVPSDYQVEFYNTIVDTSVADTLFPKSRLSNRFPAQPVKFKVKNLTRNEYIDFFYGTSGVLTTIHSIFFKEHILGKYIRTWKVDISYSLPKIPLETQGKLTLSTLKPFNHSDRIRFKMKGSEIENSLAKSQMDLIKVVPNPYIVTHEAEARLLSTQTSGRGEREIRFTHIPPGSKISIFTVRGELIKTLHHIDLYVGDVYWNLRTEENIDVAYGVYVYVVEAEGIGKKIGKFALIK
ncbi:MAG: hypothetical protein NTX22_16115 [Ignavibacteriales bacterium]|nr:hypothetical protein [Ignavibacteriales bacterium]